MGGNCNMLVFIFSGERGVSVGSVNNELLDELNVSIDEVAKQYSSEYFILESAYLPKEPQESWYIEDGEIKIDQQKLIKFNRQNMPQLTPIEFDTKLVAAGLYAQVQSLISKDIKLRIAYTRATSFRRTDFFINRARIALGLTDEQVDAIWVS